MGAVKRLERWLKYGLAVLLSVAWWRPWRAQRAKDILQRQGRKRIVLVRIDNRVGEALLSTPLMTALFEAGHEVHALVHPKMRRVLNGHPHLATLWDYRPSLSALRGLRGGGYDVVINCGNWTESSVTSAVVARWIAAHCALVGPSHFPAGLLMDVPIAPRGDTVSEAAQRAHLASPLVQRPPSSSLRLSFRNTAPFSVVDAPYAVVNPGGRLGYRRVPPQLFADACTALHAQGVRPLVTWGPGEEALADEVCRLCPTAMRAPPTSLDELASLMRGATLTVCNNTGPMHLSVAVDCPTLALFFHVDMARWGHAYAPHVMLDVTDVVDASTVVREAVKTLLVAKSRGENGVLSGSARSAQ